MTLLTRHATALSSSRFLPNNDVTSLARVRWLVEMFDSVDRTASGLINETQATSLVKKLSTGLTTVKIQQKLTVSGNVFKM